MGSAQTQGELWGARAREWADLQEVSFGPLYDAALKAAKAATGSAVLDVGCGAGLALKMAQARGAKVSGLDAAAGLVEIARSRCPGGAVPRRAARRAARRAPRPAASQARPRSAGPRHSPEGRTCVGRALRPCLRRSALAGRRRTHGQPSRHPRGRHRPPPAPPPTAASEERFRRVFLGGIRPATSPPTSFIRTTNGRRAV